MTRFPVAFALVMCFAPLASAGLLAVDPAGLPGFTGSQPFVSGTLNASVDYAVFALGTFPAAQDPSAGSDFVYAYQVFSLGSAPVSFFTVGLIIPGSHNATVDPLYATPGGTPPTAWTLQSSSAVGVFFTPNLLAPGYSPVLLFTNPNPPTFTFASVADGGQSSQKTLPTPIPEPASLALGLLTVGALLRRSR